jgi:hypothetical protein
MAARAASRALARRAAAAGSRKMVLSAIVVIGGEALKGCNDPVEAGLNPFVVVDQSELPVRLGDGDEYPVALGLLPVDIDELDRGLEVGTGETGIEVGAVLLRRPGLPTSTSWWSPPARARPPGPAAGA